MGITQERKEECFKDYKSKYIMRNCVEIDLYTLVITLYDIDRYDACVKILYS